MDVHCEMASTGSKRRRHHRRTDVEPCILGVRVRLCAFPPRVAHGRPQPYPFLAQPRLSPNRKRASIDLPEPHLKRAPHRVRSWPSISSEFSCCSRTSMSLTVVVSFFSPPGTRLFDIPPGPCWDDGVKQVQFNVVCFFFCCETASLCQNLSWVEVAGIRPGPGLR